MTRKSWDPPKVLTSVPLHADALPPTATQAGDDATAAQRQLEALARAYHEQRELLQVLMDAIPGFVCVKELGGRFAIANRCLADAYGTTPEGLVGHSDHDFNPDSAQVDGFIAADRDVIVNRIPKHIPAERFTTFDGQERWLRTTKIPLVDSAGVCSQLLAVAIDITEQHRLQRELEHLRRSSEDLAAPRSLRPAAGERHYAC